MLLQRLKNHRTMDDGVIWSAQADFIARLADWENEFDSFGRCSGPNARLSSQLNVPHFVSPSDGNEIRDANGISVRTQATSGMDRARARVQNFDEQDIAWQIAVIRQNTARFRRSDGGRRRTWSRRSSCARTADAAPTRQIFIAEADKIAEELTGYAIRRGPGAAWIGLDWLGDSEVSQLVCLGPDLYNGVSGIAVFLAAHASVTGRRTSEELALAAISHFART